MTILIDFLMQIAKRRDETTINLKRMFDAPLILLP
jgi:hypothetical protein